ncbi:MAG: ABC transporter ATP-binding protein [Miltoncostaeaceae bacterium]
MGAPLIALEDASKTYTLGGSEFIALDGVSLSVSKGEFVAVVGPSGCGKSTLLNLVAGIDRPSGGTIEVAGTDVAALTEDETARWRGRVIGVVFQFFQLLPVLTLEENVMLPMDFRRVHAKQDRVEVARELLERVGLADAAGKLPSQVSGGQQQRAAIARALANDPELIVADEPTGNLDSANAHAMMDLFIELSERGRTVLMVTHDEEQTQRVDRIVRMRDGRLVPPPPTP